MFPKAYIESLVKIGLAINDLGPRSKNYIDLKYSHTFINSISCLHLLTFRSHAAIVYEKSTVFTFSYRKAYFTKFDLTVKYVKVNPGSPIIYLTAKET